eukprot:1152616-Pelagomonas_calceolata.AAC.1
MLTLEELRHHFGRSTHLPVIGVTKENFKMKSMPFGTVEQTKQPNHLAEVGTVEQAEQPNYLAEDSIPMRLPDTQFGFYTSVSVHTLPSTASCTYSATKQLKVAQ